MTSLPHDLLAETSPALVAILRGITLPEVPAVAQALYDAGVKIWEIPLNRPHALACIAEMVKRAPGDVLVGAGTVLDCAAVDAVHDCGGRLIVSPNMSAAVIGQTKARGMLSAPGVCTPTEAFAALEAGADVLKVFPAEIVSPAGVAALRSVLPSHARLWPVGGITPQKMGDYWQSGARGFGIGGALYQPATDIATLSARAKSFVQAFNQLSAQA